MSTSPGGPAPPGGPVAPGGSVARAHRVPPWLFPLGMVVALEPPVLIVLWFLDTSLANGHLIGIALVGGLFISLPSLAILGLAVIWDRRLATGQPVPGLPEALTGATASRISAITLAFSTIVLGAVIALLLGPWALLALPPLLLSLGSAWLMVRSA